MKPNQKVSATTNILAKQHQEDEAIIKAGLKAFYEVGAALVRIRDSKSYKEVAGYNTFEEYCMDKWDISRPQAYRLIDSVKLIENLSPIGDILPETESQCRELSYLKPDVQRKVWQMVLDSGQKVTAKLIKEMVNEYHKPEPVVGDDADEKVGDPSDGQEREKTYAEMEREFKKQEREEKRREERLKASAKGKKWEELNDEQKKLRDNDRYWKEYYDKLNKMDDFFNRFAQGGTNRLSSSAFGKLKEIIHVGYRELSKKYHPDVGGSNQDMIELTDAKNHVLMMLTIQ